MPHIPVSPVLENIAIFVTAMTAVIAVQGRRIDLFGVVVLALVASFGGGTVRDMLLGRQAAWLTAPSYFASAMAGALLTFFVARFRAVPDLILQVADVFSMALFTMIGTQKGLDAPAPLSVPVLVLLGVATGVAGGILRDVAIGRVPMVFRSQIKLYATAAVAGSLVYIWAMRYPDIGQVWASIIGITAVMALRLAALRWELSLPELKA